MSYHIIRHNVNHEIHSPIMEGGREVFSVLRGAVVGIERVAGAVSTLSSGKRNCRPSILHVLLPVSMIPCPFSRVLGQLLRHGRDPNGCEAHSLDVIQLYIYNVPNRKLSNR
jgi:hypothetical protein